MFCWFPLSQDFCENVSVLWLTLYFDAIQSRSEDWQLDLGQMYVVLCRHDELKQKCPHELRDLSFPCIFHVIPDPVKVMFDLYIQFV